MLAGLGGIKCRSRTFIKNSNTFCLAHCFIKYQYIFLNSEGGIRLRGSSFLPGEAVSLQLGVVLVLFMFCHHTDLRSEIKLLV